MKRLALLILLATTLHSYADIPADMPETVYDDIVTQVMTETGYFDSVAIEEAISQWLLDQPLEANDAQLLDSGVCNVCEADSTGVDTGLNQPRNVKIKAKPNQQGSNLSYPTTYKITWKQPASLPANSAYQLSH